MEINMGSKTIIILHATEQNRILNINKSTATAESNHLVALGGVCDDTVLNILNGTNIAFGCTSNVSNWAKAQTHFNEKTNSRNSEAPTLT